MPYLLATALYSRRQLPIPRRLNAVFSKICYNNRQSVAKGRLGNYSMSLMNIYLDEYPRNQVELQIFS
jgi:hypothetical protein